VLIYLDNKVIAKPFADSKRRQTRVKNQLKEKSQSTLAFLGLHNFIATKIEVLNSDTNQCETFHLVGEGKLEFTETQQEETTDVDLDNINMWLYLKEKFNISNEAWHEIAMKAKGVPNINRIGKQINELNKKWNLKPTAGDVEGNQLSFKESLEEHIVRLQHAGDLNDGETFKNKS